MTQTFASPAAPRLRRVRIGALAAGALALVCPLRARAQGVCFEPSAVHFPGATPGGPTLADLDGDADLDIVFANDTTHTLELALDQGPAGFAPATVLATVPSYVRMPSIVARDFDGDGDNDLAVLSHANLLGPATGSVQMWLNQGGGTFAASGITSTWTEPQSMVAGDVDGDGDVDLVLSHHGSQSMLYTLVNDGVGGLSLLGQPLATNSGPEQSQIGDLDLDGDLDLITWNLGGTYVLLNDGVGTFAPVPGATSGYQAVLADIDGDLDLDLIGPIFTPAWNLAIRRNVGGGTFDPAVGVPGATQPSGFAVGDFDGDGDADLVLTRGSGPDYLEFLANSGSGAFTHVAGPAYAQATSRPVTTDVDGDGDPDLVLSPSSGFVVMRNCRLAGAPFCAGDGTGSACPCGNASAPGAGAGCLNSFGTAGTLRGTGGASIANDAFVLDGTGMPNSAVLYFQGTSAQNGGAGSVFGDGLRCAGGSVLRLGTAQNVGGASSFPAPLAPRISVVGAITAPGERVYQAWYRNSAPFCAAPGFNLTNGLRVAWFP